MYILKGSPWKIYKKGPYIQSMPYTCSWTLCGKQLHTHTHTHTHTYIYIYIGGALYSRMNYIYSILSIDYYIEQY